MNTATARPKSRPRGTRPAKPRRFQRGSIQTDAAGTCLIGCWIDDGLNGLLKDALALLAADGRDTDRSKFMRSALHSHCRSILGKTSLN